MRTTLSIEDDVLDAARAIAARQGRPVGDVVSELARKGLRQSPRIGRTRNGIALLPRRTDGGPVSPELVDRLRDELP